MIIHYIRRAICALTPTTILLTVLATAAFAGPPAGQAITSFKFETQYNAGKIEDDIVADIYGDTLIVAIIPYQLKDLNLVATFETQVAETVKIGDVDQVSTVTVNDFSDPPLYIISSSEGTMGYRVRLVYTGLPLVYVYTDGAAPILNRDDYVSGTVKVYPNVDTLDIVTGAMGIRGRGNTTWTLDKKPYRIKLAEGASMLGMPSDKDWVLLANHADKSLMRNSLAYHLGAQMNFPYTPRTTPVDLVLNGVYQGSYVLGEHVKADKDRVNVEDLEPTDTDPAVITGGYFLELDQIRDGLVIDLASGLPFVIKSPDEDDINEAQLDYIHGYMQETEDAIFSEEFANPETGYAKYIDAESFIEWYWVNELFKNIDADDFSSIFYYKDRGEKLHMGPLWDFDAAAGNATVDTGDDPTTFFVRNGKWMKRLFEDPAFKAAADARWATFRDELLVDLPTVIDSFATKLHLSQEQNFKKWNVLDKPIWPALTTRGSYQAEVDYLKTWFSERIAWIDAQIIPVMARPVLHSPATADTVEGISPTLAWRKTSLATQYKLQVSTAESFATLVIDKSGLTDTTYAVTEELEAETTYYWRVQASNADQTSDWSQVWSFKTPLINGVGDITYGISMFPNPTTSELYIDVPSGTQIENAELIDVLGRTAASSSLVPGVTTRVDVSNLKRGIYVIILRGKMDRPVTSKVMLR